MITNNDLITLNNILRDVLKLPRLPKLATINMSDDSLKEQNKKLIGR